ncbi:hypothetical protein Bhyg_03290 [Pseudolycoriella hygida]|uniref:Uncharacterized protein n=1 Tax=Pseudolycoriella hygida TaxID=35572 RepID=A0A9Q0S995_9DIPT|nr:hypothetical protein Bhyg_03290 [Pseudolycoriella hygida]
MAESEVSVTLLSSFGENFFSELEKSLKTKIPSLIKNILVLMDIDRSYMKFEFKENDKINPDDELKDYLGKFVNQQEDFVMSYGHKLMINAMVRACQDARKCNEQNSKQHTATAVETIGPNTFTQAVTLKPSEDNIALLFQSLRCWISNNSAFAQLRHDHLSFEVLRNTYKLKEDGTIHCTVKCPITTCSSTFCVSYKRYKSSYKPKKKAVENQREVPARWHTYIVQLHMLNVHTAIENSGDNISLEGSSESVLPFVDNQSTEGSDQILMDEQALRKLTPLPSTVIDNQSTEHKISMEGQALPPSPITIENQSIEQSSSDKISMDEKPLRQLRYRPSTAMQSKLKSNEHNHSSTSSSSELNQNLENIEIHSIYFLCYL